VVYCWYWFCSWALHHMDVETVAGVSEAHSDFIFRVDVSRVGAPCASGFWCTPWLQRGMFYIIPLFLFLWIGHSSNPSTSRPLDLQDGGNVHLWNVGDTACVHTVQSPKSRMIGNRSLNIAAGWRVSSFWSSSQIPVVSIIFRWRSLSRFRSN
jgi:hypothetical protein